MKTKASSSSLGASFARACAAAVAACAAALVVAPPPACVAVRSQEGPPLGSEHREANEAFAVGDRVKSTNSNWTGVVQMIEPDGRVRVRHYGPDGRIGERVVTYRRGYLEADNSASPGAPLEGFQPRQDPPQQPPPLGISVQRPAKPADDDQLPDDWDEGDVTYRRSHLEADNSTRPQHVFAQAPKPVGDDQPREPADVPPSLQKFVGRWKLKAKGIQGDLGPLAKAAGLWMAPPRQLLEGVVFCTVEQHLEAEPLLALKIAIEIPQPRGGSWRVKTRLMQSGSDSSWQLLGSPQDRAKAKEDKGKARPEGDGPKYPEEKEGTARLEGNVLVCEHSKKGVTTSYGRHGNDMDVTVRGSGPSATTLMFEKVE